MKRLTLVRHAKSDWNNQLPDLQRPLNTRGEQDAPYMASRMAMYYSPPDQLLCSSALRAQQTAQLLAAELQLADDCIVLEPRLYNAEAGEILSAIRQTDDRIQHLMVVAHNPGLTRLANQLTDSHIDNLVTCAVLGAALEIQHWADARSGRAIFYDYPKNTEKPIFR